MCIPFSAARPECLTDNDCEVNLACIQQRCLDPCSSITCGTNAICSVNSHRALCTCRKGFEGDPYTSCVERKKVPQYIVLNKTVKNKSHFSIFKLDAKVILSALTFKHVSARTVKILASMRPVDRMPFARLEAIAPFASVLQGIKETLTEFANAMNVWLTQSAQIHWPVTRKSVRIPASVPPTLIAAPETTVVTASAMWATLVILMVMLAQNVSIAQVEKQDCVWIYASILIPLSFLSVPPPVIDTGCKSDGECPSRQACFYGDCKNPCLETRPCATNANCKVYDTLPLRTMACQCNAGFTGKGDEQCDKISELQCKYSNYDKYTFYA